MKTLIAILLLPIAALAAPAAPAAFSTEATISMQPGEGTYLVEVRVSRLVEQDGKLTEQLIAAPRLLTAPGVPATLYTGLQPADANYANDENVTAEVSWPYPKESGMASCSVIVKRGSLAVSKSKWQLKVEGPGRTPLIVTPQDVDPKSVTVKSEKSTVYVLVEFTGKTAAEVKKLARENYGNKLEVRDRQGRSVEGGRAFGTYQEIGMAVQFESQDVAERAAGILRGKAGK
jgi:hypothetical protein